MGLPFSDLFYSEFCHVFQIFECAVGVYIGDLFRSQEFHSFVFVSCFFHFALNVCLVTCLFKVLMLSFSCRSMLLNMYVPIYDIFC